MRLLSCCKITINIWRNAGRLLLLPNLWESFAGSSKYFSIEKAVHQRHQIFIKKPHHPTVITFTQKSPLFPGQTLDTFRQTYFYPKVSSVCPSLAFSSISVLY